jgi:two-component system, NarL family, sensor kinase
MKRFYSIAIFVLYFLMNAAPLQAQQALVDSIKKKLQQNLPDTVRALDMIYYAMYMEAVNMEEAHRLYKAAIDYSTSKQLWYHAGLTLRYEATPYSMQGQRQRELDNIQRAEKYFLQSDHPNKNKELAATYSNFGSYYRSIEKFDSSIFYHLKAIQIQEENNYYARLLISYINIAMIYQQIKLPEKQKLYLDKALNLAKKTNEKPGLFLAYMQATHYYTEIKDYVNAKKYIDSSRNYYYEPLDFSRKFTFHLFIAVSFQNLNLNDSAFYYYERAYEMANSYQSKWNMIEPLLQMGNIKAKQKDYINAETLLKEGIRYAEMESARTQLKDGLKYLSDLYMQTGRYQQALEVYKKHILQKDTLLNEEQKKYILDLESKYETQKKDVQLQLQQTKIKQQRIQNYALAAGAMVLLIVLLLLYHTYQQKQKLQQHRITELETEQKLLATEAVLKGEEQERSRLAKDLHDGLGGMLSGIKYSLNTMKGNLIMTPDNAQAFERSIDMLDNSIREMRRVAHNMMPEVLLRYGLDAALKDYTTEINKSGITHVVYESMGTESKQLDQSALLALYRVVQELLNNAMKHAAATEVLVQMFWENGKLVVNVEDNGKGFDVSLLQQSEGMGWKNIRSRVELLKGTIDIHSAPGKGTAVNLEFSDLA